MKTREKVCTIKQEVFAIDIQINFLAVLIAAIATMALGYIWYLPKVLGNTWMRLANIDLSKLNSRLAMGSAAFSLLFMAFGLAMLAYMFHAFFAHSFLTDSMLAGAFVFVGFQALRILQLAEFNQRPHLETVIHISNEFITILAMTLIIGFMGY